MNSRRSTWLITMVLLFVPLSFLSKTVTCCSSARTRSRADDIAEEAAVHGRTRKSNVTIHVNPTNRPNRNYHKAEDRPYFVKAGDSYSFRWDLFLITVGTILVAVPVAIAACRFVIRRIRRRNLSPESPADPDSLQPDLSGLFNTKVMASAS